MISFKKQQILAKKEEKNDNEGRYGFQEVKTAVSDIGHIPQLSAGSRMNRADFYEAVPFFAAATLSLFK
jgi:hypothetical protein